MKKITVEHYCKRCGKRYQKRTAWAFIWEFDIIKYQGYYYPQCKKILGIEEPYYFSMYESIKKQDSCRTICRDV